MLGEHPPEDVGVGALGSIVFGYVAHGLGYAIMWGALTALLAVGFAWSLRLRPGAARPRALPAPRPREGESRA